MRKRISDIRKKICITLLYLLMILFLSALGYHCIYRTMLGIPCPGCGMTRAVRAALRFDFATAFSYHPMFWSLPILYLGFLCDGKVFSKRNLNILLWSLLGGGFLLQWFIRLPF